MVKKIRLLLEYRCFPVWLYDENGDIIDTMLPKELRSDTELNSKFDDIQTRYDALFIDNTYEFSFVGFKSVEERERFCSDWNAAYNELIAKLKGKYIIQNDVKLDF